MNSRMNKYYTEEFKSSAKRTNKNADIYKSLYGNYDDLGELPVSDNEMEITDINKVVTTREEYRRRKQYASINPQELQEEKITKQVPNKPVNTAKKIYDINVLLEKAREEIKNLEKENTNTNEYLQKLQTDDQIKTDLEKVKEMYKELEKEYAEEKEVEHLNTQNLSLELLSDLKSDNDNTEVTPPLKEEIQEKVADDTIAHKIELDDGEKFYSGTFKKQDFSQDDDFYDGEINKGSYALKVVLLIIGICALTVLTLYFLDYYNIVNVIPKGV